MRPREGGLSPSKWSHVEEKCSLPTALPGATLTTKPLLTFYFWGIITVHTFFKRVHLLPNFIKLPESRAGSPSLPWKEGRHLAGHRNILPYHHYLMLCVQNMVLRATSLTVSFQVIHRATVSTGYPNNAGRAFPGRLKGWTGVRDCTGGKWRVQTLELACPG